MAENERHARPNRRPFHKEFGRGRKFGPNDIETGVQNFFLRVSQGKTRPPAITLGSLAMGNML